MRDRREDIPLLARHFMGKSARELGVEVKRLADATLKYLGTLEWPGNVRQLENVCHWLTVMAPAQTIEVADLPSDLRAVRSEAGEAIVTDWVESLEQEVSRRLAAGETAIGDDLTRLFESALIRNALRHTGGRRIEAANLLGMGRNTITRKISELKIEDRGD